MFDDVLRNKSRNFALQVIAIFKILTIQRKEFTLSKQVLRSGTSIGANIAEAKYAQSKSDFISKLSIALKEAAETEYWLDLLFQSYFLTKEEYNNANEGCIELIKLLTASIKTSKSNNP